MRERFQQLVSSGLLAFMATLIVHGLATGGHPRIATDTKLYVGLADDLLSGSLSGILTPEAVRWSKLIFIGALALARRISATHWAAIIAALNVLCSAIAALVLTRFTFRATGSAAATVAALFYYLAINDIAYWVPFVMTDIFNLLMSLLLFAVIGRAVIGEPLRHHRLMLVLAIAGAALSRPTSVILALVAIFAEIVFVAPPEAHPRLKRLLTIGVLACAVVAVCARTYVIAHPSKWPVSWIRSRVVLIADVDKLGEVMFPRLETFRPPPQTLLDYAILEAVRFARFFQFTAPSYSMRHNVVNSIVFGSMYAFGLYAVFDALRGRDRRRRGLVFMTLLWIGVSVLFIALTILDAEWRYRVPLLPQFIVLAGLGVGAIVTSRSSPRRAAPVDT